MMSGKNKVNIINLSSAEFVQTVVKVNKTSVIALNNRTPHYFYNRF